MRVDGLAITLRPRPMAEAADLGVAMVRTHARSVWRSFLPLYVVVVAVALCTAQIATWLPPLLLFCLKPWFDRSLLFILARAVFGQPTRWADLWQNRRAVWGGHLLRTFVGQRLSPWRSYTQAIDQLEGQRGRAWRHRRNQLLKGRRGAPTGLQVAFSHVEIALHWSLLSIAFWFLPEAHLSDAFRWLFTDDSLLSSVLVSAAYAVVVGWLEPFYVGAGFAMYLNRRVELEAWDIEQEFRHAFAA